MFHTICRNSKFLVAADAEANCDASCQNFMEQNFEESEITHLIFTYQPYKRKLCITDSKEMFMKSFMDDVRKGNKVAMMCRTIENCLLFRNLRIRRYPRKG